jgi:hypothetical protein
MSMARDVMKVRTWRSGPSFCGASRGFTDGFEFVSVQATQVLGVDGFGLVIYEIRELPVGRIWSTVVSLDRYGSSAEAGNVHASHARL